MNSYRLHLTTEHGFNDAARTLEYLERLGVTVVYTAPYFVAGSGSSGYDVCDHTRIQPELGGESGFDRFVEALRRQRLGHLIDVVPNHMGTDTVRNRWWRDVLQHGMQSSFASYFDIDWEPDKAELRGRILLPILNKPYGDALSDGDIQLARRADEYVVLIGSQDLPVKPGSVPDGTVADTIADDALHAVLERQVYRLAYWRTASDEINYRRFFDVDGLIGLRMEEDAVFQAAHQRVAALVAQGVVTGIRVDHPDGLARPAEYFQRLQSLPRPAGAPPLHIVAEKILTDGEQLPADWPADGTTGYEFLNLVTGLFVRAEGMVRLRRMYMRLTKRLVTFEEESYQSRRIIMATTMASEVHMLAHRLNRISERQPRSRDFTLNSLRRALVEIIASFSVYRTYLSPDGGSPEDFARVREAASRAAARNPALEGSVFRFIAAVVVSGAGGSELVQYPAADDRDLAERRRFTERLQQFTGSVFAKGVEDTAFYRYQPLLSLNEVGGDPGLVGRSPAAFHASNGWRAAHAPRGLLTTSTHDTKMGEDARARVSVLSELPVEWSRMLGRWRRAHRASVVDANDVYRFYQALVATCPVQPLDLGDVELYTERLVEYMRKSVREAKTHTSWLNQNDAYEAAVTRLVTDTVRRVSAAPPNDVGLAFLRRVARLGATNSLAQLVLKLGAPGVVDVYQGAELWDLNLVDPDNRRAVDFDQRGRILAELEPLLESAAAGAPDAADKVRRLVDDWPNGAIKMFVTAAGLRLRRDAPDLFVGGGYRPVDVDGPVSEHVVAYLRSHEQQRVLIVAPRFVANGPDWGGARLVLPDELADTPLHNVLTGETLRAVEQSGTVTLPVADVFRSCPVAILTKRGRVGF